MRASGHGSSTNPSLYETKRDFGDFEGPSIKGNDQERVCRKCAERLFRQQKGRPTWGVPNWARDVGIGNFDFVEESDQAVGHDSRRAMD